MKKFRIFCGIELDQKINQVKAEIQQEVYSQVDDYILNINENEFINYLVQKYSFERINIEFDKMTVSSYEKDIPSEYFPTSFYVIEGKSYKKDVIIYHIPFYGNSDLLRYKTNPLHYGLLKFSLRGMTYVLR
jgi:hypoxanthine-guanine phosphoribosyltransferase